MSLKIPSLFRWQTSYNEEIRFWAKIKSKLLRKTQCKDEAESIPATLFTMKSENHLGKQRAL